MNSWDKYSWIYLQTNGLDHETEDNEENLSVLLAALNWICKAVKMETLPTTRRK